MRHFIFSSLLLFFAQSVFAGDIVTLGNLMAFEGKVLKIKDCEIVFKASDGSKYLIPADDVYSLQFEDPSDKVYTNYLKLAADDPDACLKGQSDARNYHGKGGFHVLMGVLFGPFAIIGAAIASPKPMNGKGTVGLSENKDLFDDPVYLKCYARQARGKNVGNTALGWGAWLIFILIANSGS